VYVCMCVCEHPCAHCGYTYMYVIHIVLFSGRAVLQKRPSI